LDAKREVEVEKSPFSSLRPKMLEAAVASTNSSQVCGLMLLLLLLLVKSVLLPFHKLLLAGQV
jgi:hypothetical protein